MEPIPAFPLQKGKCLKLLSTLYGLVQTPLVFYNLLSCVQRSIQLLIIDSSSQTSACFSGMRTTPNLVNCRWEKDTNITCRNQRDFRKRSSLPGLTAWNRSSYSLLIRRLQTLSLSDDLSLTTPRPWSFSHNGSCLRVRKRNGLLKKSLTFLEGDTMTVTITHTESFVVFVFIEIWKPRAHVISI